MATSIKFAQGGWQFMVHYKVNCVNAFVCGVFSASYMRLCGFVKTIDFPR